MSYMLDLDEIKEARLVAELIERLSMQKSGVCDYCGKLLGSSWEVYRSVIVYGVEVKVPHTVDTCKEYRRHQGEERSTDEQRKKLLNLLWEATR